MNHRPATSPPPGMTLGDVLYILFRHKGKILLLSAATVAAILLIPVLGPTGYQSEARLYIRYVLESTGPSRENDPRIKSPETREDSLINTELQILTSYDVAQQVADAVGAEKILGKSMKAAGREMAALVIQRNLLAQPAKNSSVIALRFSHSDPKVVQPVLQSVIDSYFKKHTEMHAVGAFDDFLTQETDQLRTRVTQAEEELKQAREKAGVLSFPDSKKAYTEQIAKIRQELFDAEAELAERQASVKAMENFASGKPIGATNVVASTNHTAVSPQIVAEYKQVSRLLETLEKKQEDLLLTFKPENALVKVVREQIAKNRDYKQRLEEENPSLSVIGVPSTNTFTSGPVVDRWDVLNTEMVKVSALQSKIHVLANQLESIRKEANATQEAEMTINGLQRKLDLEEGDYKRFSGSLRQSRIDEKVGAGKVSNISVIQAPSPPLHDTKQQLKIIGFVLLGGLALAFLTPFVIELYLDRSLKRPIDVERKLGLPLFISIPVLALRGKSGRFLRGKTMRLLTQRGETSEGSGPSAPSYVNDKLSTFGNGDAPSETMVQATEMAPWDSRHALRPFSEALRDRMITYFEMKNLTHKPKLVALTSCRSGSGVSTIAAGLAASLSETGDGNVLLVDMNLRNGAAHQFHRGDLACDLDVALETEKRDSVMVQDNLYVVSETANNDRLPSILPTRFKSLIPRLKASDYDYIIFDMPPVSQISLTPRLARYMDMVLMVVESGKTDSDIVKRAGDLIAESKANVGVVLNKSCSYVPKRLQQEL